MRRVSGFVYMLGAALLTTPACVGNVVESEQRLGTELPGSDAGAFSGQLDGGGFLGVDATMGLPFTPGNPVDSGSLPQPVDDGSVPVDGADADTLQPGTQNPCGTGSEPLATDLRVREISLYQTVKVALYKNNAWVSARNASIVQGKKSLVRVFVEPLTGYVSRNLRGVLTLDNAGQKTALEAGKIITAASTDEATNSTFDFVVDGAAISSATQLSVAITEPVCPTQRATGTGARFPATGGQALDAGRIGKLRVVMVPVTLGGRTPDVTATQLAKMRDALLAYYPVAEVEVTAREPISWTSAIAADGNGWSTLLNQIGRQRQADKAAKDVYYFGLITPAATFRDYCRTSCVLGLAPQTTFVSSPDQIGLGVGFVEDNTYSTVVHELGHAHGLPHAPCVPAGGSIQNADPKYPYAGGKTGSWGWDSRTSKLLPPTGFVDMMSYCDPAWISDYNYEKLATRARSVNTAASIVTFDKGAAPSWERLIWSANGQASWAGVTSHETPGDFTSAYALDATGQQVAELSVAVISLSHTADTFVYVPRLDPSWAALQIGKRRLVVADIAPAR